MSIQALALTGDQFISLQEAIKMTLLYRQEHENILIPEMRDRNVLPLSETFDRGCIDRILAQTGCEGIRLYYSMDADSKIHMIIVAVNELNEDILTSPEPLIIENGVRCPSQCPPASVLNS